MKFPFFWIDIYSWIIFFQVHAAGKEDVDRAVAAAKKAFYEGPWGTMNARDRGTLLYR